MSGPRIEPVVCDPVSSRLRAWSVQGPESDAPTLATSACPAGPENEPARGPMLGGSGPPVARVEAAGNVPNRCRRRVAIGAELPRVASDRLGLSHVGCDQQPTVPDNGRFVAVLIEQSA